jgi:hypothetical protein
MECAALFACIAAAAFVSCLCRYVLLDGWKPDNKYHQELMALHLRGNGCAKTPTIAEDLEFFRKASNRACLLIALSHSLGAGWFRG